MIQYMHIATQTQRYGSSSSERKTMPCIGDERIVAMRRFYAIENITNIRLLCLALYQRQCDGVPICAYIEKY